MAVQIATAAVMTSAFAPLADRSREACAILYLDAERRLVGSRHVAGSIDTVPLAVRTVAADALAFGAQSAVIAHNHPSGDAEPSAGDLAFTRALARGLDALNVTLRDHVILTRSTATSLRARGVL